MKCQAVRKKLIGHLDGELPEHERHAIAQHLAACADCRAEADALRRAEDALRALNVVETAPDLTADLHQRIATRRVRVLSRRWASAGLALVAIFSALAVWLYPRTGLQPAHQPTQVAERSVGSRHVAQPPVRATLKGPPQGVPEGPPSAVMDRRERLSHIAPIQEPKPRSALKPRRLRPVLPVIAERPPATAAEAPARDVEPTVAFFGEPAKAQDRAVEVPVGIILVLGTPEPAPPSYSCYIEVSMPDGTKSIREQAVERDDAGEIRAIRIACENITPEPQTPNRGG